MDHPVRGGRPVSEAGYRGAISRHTAQRDPTLHNRGGIGEVERWLRPDGEYLFVRYRKGEHHYDYHAIDRS